MWHVKEFRRRLWSLFGVGSEEESQEKSGKNLGGCVTPASADKSVVVVQRNSKTLQPNQDESCYQPRWI